MISVQQTWTPCALFGTATTPTIIASNTSNPKRDMFMCAPPTGFRMIECSFAHRAPAKPSLGATQQA
ncbi:MAG: hypothetical protein CMJ18_11690 [Phycisphaeraceae bacterium]|nr:hypothetical protein [Phycisphaeraceae bacterium]